jgi:hypothetical protein
MGVRRGRRQRSLRHAALRRGNARSTTALGRIPGGSTSGGADLGHRRMAAATIGSDTGGSVRIPAALERLCGFKPTARRVPLEGAYPLSRLDSIGRSRGASAIACCSTRSCSGERSAKRAAAVRLRGLRLGVAQGCQDALDPEIARPFERALSKLSAAGAQLIDFDWTELDDYPAIHRQGRLLGRRMPCAHIASCSRRAAAIRSVVAVREAGPPAQSAAVYIDLLNARADWIARSRKTLGDYDALIAPTVPVLLQRMKPISTTSRRFGEYFKRTWRLLRNAQVINFLDRLRPDLTDPRMGQPGRGVDRSPHGDGETTGAGDRAGGRGCAGSLNSRSFRMTSTTAPQGRWQFLDRPRRQRSPTFVARKPDGSLATHKLLSENPERYSRRRGAGHPRAARLARRAHPARAGRGRQDGHDGRDQRAARAQGRAHAAGDHARLPRRAAHRVPEPAEAVHARDRPADAAVRAAIEVDERIGAQARSCCRSTKRRPRAICARRSTTASAASRSC